MLRIILPLLVALVGLLLQFISGNPKLQEIGKWMFICGLFWCVSPFVSQEVTLIK